NTKHTKAEPITGRVLCADMDRQHEPPLCRMQDCATQSHCTLSNRLRVLKINFATALNNVCGQGPMLTQCGAEAVSVPSVEWPRALSGSQIARQFGCFGGSSAALLQVV